MTIGLDFETRSLCDLRAWGAYKYAEDASTDILCYAFSLGSDDAPVECEPGELHPDLAHAVRSGEPIRAWNAGFEYLIWNRVCVPRYGWPRIEWGQLRDTMAQAAARNLPQALGQCAIALGLPADKQKDKRGQYLITHLSKPVAAGGKKGEFREDAALLAEMRAYCAQDVAVEREIARILRPLSDYEQAAWVTTQQINERGLPVALDEIENIIGVVHQETAFLNDELFRLTGVPAATQRDKLLENLRGRGVNLEDLTGETIEHALAGEDLSDDNRRVLQIRASVCQTSTAKYAKMRGLACKSGRVHGSLTYHGASTGRDASRGINLQNLARPTVKNTDACSASLALLDWPRARLIWGEELMNAAVSALRGVIKAPDGYDFLDADFSSVENRAASWIAGQQDKLDAFAAGMDEYKNFATDMYHIAYADVSKHQRQVSKSAVLGCFGPNTQVMTDSGWKEIQHVTISDRVFDGVEFVVHQGVAYQGIKRVIDIGGVLVTPEHQFLQGENQWERADTIDLNLATRTASGLWSATPCLGGKPLPLLDVNAARKLALPSPRCAAEGQRGAGRATTRTSRRIECLTNPDGMTAGLPRFPDAKTPGAQHSPRTAVEESGSFTNGAKARMLFSRLSKRYRDGMTQALRWTALITMGTMRQGICAWQTGQCKTGIAEIATKSGGMERRYRAPNSGESMRAGTRLKALSNESYATACPRRPSSRNKAGVEVHTFDVVNAGPRSRFVILTNAGPVVVHNCMFGQGWKGLIDYATTYGVTLDEEESRSLVGVYRGQYPHVQKTWYACGDAMLNALRSPGVAFDVGRHIKFLFDGHWLNLRLPSGRVIAWYQPTIEPRETPWGAIRDAVVCWQTNPLTKKYERKVLIGSSAFQSAVQGSARDLLIHGVNNVDAAGYPVVLRVHDEVLSLVPEGFGDADEFGARLCAQPTWAADLPLAYEAWRGKRFRK